MSERLHLPEPVKLEVRQRCRFACVICRAPLYDYDHITQYSEVGEHDASNIVLLCPTHHSQKTRGQLPAARVRAASEAVESQSSRGLTGSTDLFFEGRLTVWLGSNQIDIDVADGRSTTYVVVVDDTVVLGLQLVEGRPLITARLFDQDNNPVLVISNSELRFAQNLWDITYIGNTITVRLSKRRILLEVLFQPELGQIRIQRGRIYAHGIGLEIKDGALLVLNRGHVIERVRMSALGGGLRFGDQTRPELRRFGAAISFNPMERYAYAVAPLPLRGHAE